MAVSSNSTALPSEDALFEARNKLSRIKDLNELMFMAGEGMLGISRQSANAVTAGCDVISDLLKEVCSLLDNEEGGEE
jgi:hypothetical protein